MPLAESLGRPLFDYRVAKRNLSQVLAVGGFYTTAPTRRMAPRIPRREPRDAVDAPESQADKQKFQQNGTISGGVNAIQGEEGVRPLNMKFLGTLDYLLLMYSIGVRGRCPRVDVREYVSSRDAKYT